MTKAHPPARTPARRTALLSLLLASAAWPALAADTSAAEQLARWNAAAGASGNVERGRIFFASQHGKEWSCASCHQAPPTRDGKHASTGRRIAPLAPAFNPQAFTETAKVEGCDLIVMGSHGRKGMEALFLGSVAQKVLTHAKVPVLIVKS